MSFPIRTTAVTLLLCLAAGPLARAHVFEPTQAAGIDIFLDQGPAVLTIDGKPCHAEMLMASLDPSVVTVGTGSTNKPFFALKLFGKKAGAGTVTVTVNDGFYILDGKKEPCGEGGTVYAFEVRVWPSKADYEKKLKAVIKKMLKDTLGSTKEALKTAGDKALAALKQFKLSQLGLVPEPAAFGSVSVETMFGTAAAWNGVHKKLQEAVDEAKHDGTGLLADCGFGEPHVVEAGFLPGAAQAGGGTKVHLQLKKLDATIGKSLDKLESNTKKSLKKLTAEADKHGTSLGNTYRLAHPKLKASFALPPLSLSKDPPGAPPPSPPLIGMVFSVDVLGLEPSLHVSGLAEPGAVLTVSVRSGAGPVTEDDAVVAGEDGDFSVSFEEGIPRGQAVEVLVTDGASGDSDAAVIHIAHHSLG